MQTGDYSPRLPGMFGVLPRPTPKHFHESTFYTRNSLSLSLLSSLLQKYLSGLQRQLQKRYTVHTVTAVDIASSERRR